MKALAYAVLLLSAFATAALVRLLLPASLDAALALGGWLLLPHALLALIVVLLAKDRASASACLLVCLAVAGGGLLWMGSLMFGRPDAQGGLAVVATPIYQLAGAGLLFPIALWLARRDA